MRFKLIILSLGLLLTFGMRSPLCGQTFLVDGRAMSISDTQTVDDALWVTSEDLQRLTGFTVKPEGACREEICIPMTAELRRQLIRSEGATSWIQLDMFLDKVKQPVAIDKEEQVWSLGRRVGSLANYRSKLAEDFELRDRSDNVIRLSDFRGKKIILFTWASW